MIKKHHIIYIPGLNDSNSLNKPFHLLAQMVWIKQRFYPHIFYPHWEKGSHFYPKLQKLTNLIDALITQRNIVSLVGQSAGGSAALNAFFLRRKTVKGVVNITGRLKKGINVKPTLEKAAKNSPAFKEFKRCNNFCAQS